MKFIITTDKRIMTTDLPDTFVIWFERPAYARMKLYEATTKKKSCGQLKVYVWLVPSLVV